MRRGERCGIHWPVGYGPGKAPRGAEPGRDSPDATLLASAPMQSRGSYRSWQKPPYRRLTASHDLT